MKFTCFYYLFGISDEETDKKHFGAQSSSGQIHLPKSWDTCQVFETSFTAEMGIQGIYID
jgi:hypothetical protein